MTNIILQPTQMAHWYTVVNEAEIVCHCQLNQDLESYLVFLLMRFMDKPEIATSIVLEEFLQGLEKFGRIRNVALQSLGDKCLLLTGFFPERAKKQCGDLDFISDLGKMAYRSIQENTRNDLYKELAQAWSRLQEILHIIRFGRDNTAFH